MSIRAGGGKETVQSMVPDEHRGSGALEHKLPFLRTSVLVSLRVDGTDSGREPCTDTGKRHEKEAQAGPVMQLAGELVPKQHGGQPAPFPTR